MRDEAPCHGDSCGRCVIGEEGEPAAVEPEEHEMRVQELQDQILAMEQQLAEMVAMKAHVENSAGATPSCCFYARKGSCKHGNSCRYVRQNPSRIWQLVGRFPMRCDRMLRHGSCHHYDASHHP